ncbi:MAG: hypothetical protein MK538_09515 [Planctomycetes bacterium]|nr:hypothetical protein [Planctomycetota bacterium]
MTRFRIAIVSALLSVNTFSVMPVQARDPIELGARREIFVDRHLIDQLDGAELRLCHPRLEGMAIPFDEPWEGVFCGYPTVIQDSEGNGDRYLLYYRGSPKAGRDGTPTESVCYAESSDGIHWKKPKLGLFEVQGTRDNNVVLANAAPVMHNFTPFIDKRPGVPKSERFKAVGGTDRSGLIGYQSADGIRWTRIREEPIYDNGVFDSQNIAFWSESEQRYVLYFRIWSEGGFTEYKGLRAIGRATSKDFLHWDEPQKMVYDEPQTEQFYTNGTQPYFRAPHIYTSMAKRFFPGKVSIDPELAKKLVENPGYRRDTADAIFMTSRGGNRYDRTFREGFIRPGADPRDWISRANAPACGVVPATDGRRMFVYRLSHYGQKSAHLARYSLRLDGFASLSAGFSGGELVTKPLRFSGKSLSINFATSAAGGVRIEIQDASGKPFDGYALADCAEAVGDQIERSVLWKSGSDVSRLAGKTVRLRFVLRDADLYSFSFQ